MSEPPRRPSSPPPHRDAGARADVAAAWEARKELGPEYDEHIASGLADRVEELVAYRTAELRQRGSAVDSDLELERIGQRQGFVLGIISLGVGVPITAISASNVEPGLLGVAVSWMGIVGVNLAHRLGNRRRRS
jgi:hypothetical protein